MYHFYQIEVYAAGQDKICAKFSIGHLVFSYLQSTKHQVSSLRGSRLSSKVAGIFAIFSIQFILLRSKFLSSDSIPRRFLSSSSLILRIRRFHLVIVNIARTQLLKRTLRLLRSPEDSAQMIHSPTDGRSPSFEYCANKQQANEATSVEFFWD